MGVKLELAVAAAEDVQVVDGPAKLISGQSCVTELSRVVYAGH